MSKLIPILLITVILVFLSERNSVVEIGDSGIKKYISKDKFWISILAISLGVFVGLRTWGNDTTVYIMMYRALGTDYSAIDWSLGANPGFWVVNVFLKRLNISTQNYLMIYSLTTLIVYIWFIRKYSENIPLSVYLFITTGVYLFTFAGIKQSIAVAFCLIAVDKAIKKKWVWFVFFIVIGMTFHPYAFMYLLVPIMSFIPWSKRTWALMIATLVIGFSLEFLLGSIIDITSSMGEEYTAEFFTDQGVNPYRVLVAWAPIVLSFFARNKLLEENDTTTNIVVNLTMLNAEVLFIGLFGTANYFARLANYFLIFQCIALPAILNHFIEKTRKILIISIIILYFGYFFYEHAIIRGGVDSGYSFMSLADYFNTNILV